MGLATGFDDDGGSDWLLMESWYASSMMATAGGTATEDAQSRWSSSRGTIFGENDYRKSGCRGKCFLN